MSGVEIELLASSSTIRDPNEMMGKSLSCLIGWIAIGICAGIESFADDFDGTGYCKWQSGLVATIHWGSALNPIQDLGSFRRGEAPGRGGVRVIRANPSSFIMLIRLRLRLVRHWVDVLDLWVRLRQRLMWHWVDVFETEAETETETHVAWSRCFETETETHVALSQCFCFGTETETEDSLSWCFETETETETHVALGRCLCFGIETETHWVDFFALRLRPHWVNFLALGQLCFETETETHWVDVVVLRLRPRCETHAALSQCQCQCQCQCFETETEAWVRLSQCLYFETEALGETHMWHWVRCLCFRTETETHRVDFSVLRLRPQWRSYGILSRLSVETETET